MLEITEVQKQIERATSNILLEEEERKMKELDVLMEQEELLWFQKSREKWIAFGDRNTKYFHMSTIIRRRRNRIEKLNDDHGQWISEKMQLENLAYEYYGKLYSLDDVDLVVETLPRGCFTRLQNAEAVKLENCFELSKVENAVRSMGKLKAPGPDGYQPIFYQENWDIVGPSVTKFVLEFFEDGVLPEGLNDAILVLIPKVAQPEKIAQFKPISLCNVLFKTITKMMVIRLKRVISDQIGPA